jgi:hypothetical protein
LFKGVTILDSTGAPQFSHSVKHAAIATDPSILDLPWLRETTKAMATGTAPREMRTAHWAKLKRQFEILCRE